MKTKVITILIHALFLSVFFYVPVFLKPEFFLKAEPESWQMTILINNLLAVIIFYVNYLYLIPKYILNNKYAHFIAYAILVVATCLSTPFFLNILFANNSIAIKLITGSSFLVGTLLFFATSFLLAFAVRFSQEWQRIRQEKKELQHEMNSAELMLLKKQLNPHFFFNTLNGIYAMIIKQSPFASKAVLQLSNMMRYILYDSDTDSIALAKEVKYIRDYIDVQKMRVTENNQIFFTVTGNFEDTTIFPLLFIPFVENAFKYGISSDRDTVIVISIAIKDNVLDFTCINDIVTKNDKSVHSGIGLKNTIKRLEIVYSDKHALNTMQADNKYIVKLKVELPC